MIKTVLSIFLVISILTSCKKEFLQLGMVTLNEDTILKTRGINWLSAENNADFKIYIERGLTIDYDDIIDDIGDGYEDVITFFAPDEYDEKVVFFLVASGKSMKKITGSSDKEHIENLNNVILLKLSESDEDEFEQIITKLISIQIWGRTEKKWLLEGVAMYVSIYDEEEIIHGDAATILQEKDVSLNTIINDFDNVEKKDGIILAASFIQYLIDKQGRDLVKAIWKTELPIDNNNLLKWEKEWKETIMEYK